MGESKNNGSRWLVLLGGAAAVAIGAWLALCGPSDRGQRDETAPATENAAAPGPTHPATAPPTEALPRLRIPAHGRLTLDGDALPDDGPLVLALDLPDDLRGSGDRTVRVVSVGGARLDTTASPLPGAGSGVRLEIERGFLSAGLYMIEIDTAEQHPLNLQRYVMEIR